jgi:RHS repeat-associated protein
LVFDRAFAPFGEKYANTGGTTEIDFTGDTQDTVAGLFDTRNRELHPNQGRWLSPDPSGLRAVDVTTPQSWNRYAYVMNAPLTQVDPLGLCGASRGFGPGCGPLPHTRFGGGDDFGTGYVNLDSFGGVDIFDAIAGAPGTYLSYDQRGNLSWGSSISLLQVTYAIIDSQRNATKEPGSGGPDWGGHQNTDPGDYPTGGFQTTFVNDGVFTRSSGVIPDFLNALVQVNYLGQQIRKLEDREWVYIQAGQDIPDALARQVESANNQLDATEQTLTGYYEQIWDLALPNLFSANPSREPATFEH